MKNEETCSECGQQIQPDKNRAAAGNSTDRQSNASAKGQPIAKPVLMRRTFWEGFLASTLSTFTVGFLALSASISQGIVDSRGLKEAASALGSALLVVFCIILFPAIYKLRRINLGNLMAGIRIRYELFLYAFKETKSGERILYVILSIVLLYAIFRFWPLISDFYRL